MAEQRRAPKIPLEQRLALSVTEAGELLGIGRSKAYELAATGVIPTVRLGDRLVVPRRRLEERLDELLEHQRGA